MPTDPNSFVRFSQLILRNNFVDQVLTNIITDVKCAQNLRFSITQIQNEYSTSSIKTGKNNFFNYLFRYNFLIFI